MFDHFGALTAEDVEAFVRMVTVAVAEALHLIQ